MILFIVAIISVCNGFLLPNNNTGGTGLTGQHLEQLFLKLSSEVKSLQQVAGLNQANGQRKFKTLNQELVQVKQELMQVQNDNDSLNQELIQVKQELMQLKKVDSNLNQELIQVKQELMQLKNGDSNLNQELIQVKHDNNNLNRELTRVKTDHSALNRKTEMLQSEIYVCGNDTMKLRTGLETFTHFISGWVLNNITQIQSNFESLENQMDKTNIQLNVLTSNSNSGNQSFMALLNQTKDTQHKMTILDTETKQNLLNYQTSTNNKIITMENYLQGYQNSINQKIITMATDLHSYQNSTIQKIVTMGTDQNSTREKIITVKNDLHSYQTSTNQKIANVGTNVQSYQTSTGQKIANMGLNLQSFQTSTGQKIATMGTALQRYKTSTGQKIANMGLDLQSFQTSTGQKIATMETDLQRYKTSTGQVVLTSRSGSVSVHKGSVVKFPNTRTVYGISDVSAFKNSGKFTCEVGGVYLFSVFIMAGTNPSEYKMYINNYLISLVNIINNTGTNNGANFHTGTGIVAVNLNVGDTLYVTASYDMYVYGFFSCMTVIKIT